MKPNEPKKIDADAENKKELSSAMEYLERLIEEKERTIQRLESEVEHYRNENKELILNQRLLFPKVEEGNTNEPNKKGFFSRLFGN